MKRIGQDAEESEKGYGEGYLVPEKLHSKKRGRPLQSAEGGSEIQGQIGLQKLQFPLRRMAKRVLAE